VNSLDGKVAVNKIGPDIIIINGVQILSSETIKSFNVPIINLHCGITPAFRGAHGGYWAIAIGQPQYAGVTIHAVDDGIDTGMILYQKRCFFSSTDNICTYPFKQYIVGIPLLLNAVEDINNGNYKPIKSINQKSKLWSHPTVVSYLLNLLFKGVK
jgi:folate-dependent phosphoribosylglycinamide formyltransferase PurN